MKMNFVEVLVIILILFALIDGFKCGCPCIGTHDFSIARRLTQNKNLKKTVVPCMPDTSEQFIAGRNRDCVMFCTSFFGYLTGSFDHLCNGCRCSLLLPNVKLVYTKSCYQLHEDSMTKSRNCALVCNPKRDKDGQWSGAYYYQEGSQEQCICYNYYHSDKLTVSFVPCLTDTFTTLEDKCFTYCDNYPGTFAVIPDLEGTQCECLKNILPCTSIDEKSPLIEIKLYESHQLKNKYPSRAKVPGDTSNYRPIRRPGYNDGYPIHLTDEVKKRDCESFCKSIPKRNSYIGQYVTDNLFCVCKEGCLCNNYDEASLAKGIDLRPICIPFKAMVFTNSRACTLSCHETEKDFGLYINDKELLLPYCICLNKHAKKLNQDLKSFKFVEVNDEYDRLEHNDLEDFENGCIAYCAEMFYGISYVNLDFETGTATCDCYLESVISSKTSEVIFFSTYPLTSYTSDTISL